MQNCHVTILTGKIDPIFHLSLTKTEKTRYLEEYFYLLRVSVARVIYLPRAKIVKYKTYVKNVIFFSVCLFIWLLFCNDDHGL